MTGLALPANLVTRIDAEGDCWLWIGQIDPNGYGRLSGQLAHRRVYEALVGPIQQGLELDHLCRVRHCVNPDHAEPVSGRLNRLRSFGWGMNARKTHCINGHPFDEANTYMVGRMRQCRACNRKAVARYAARRRTP